MLDILSAMYHDDPPMLKTLSSLVPSIEALADKKAEEGFYSGVRFGAQLMAELMAQF